MSFRWGRFPFLTQPNKESARAVDAAERSEPTTEATAMDPDLKIPINELIEAREMTDAGLRLAFPMLVDRGQDESSATQRAELDPEVIERVLARVAEMHHELSRELKHLDKHAPRSLHVSVGRAVLSLGEVLEDAVAQEWSTRS